MKAGHDEAFHAAARFGLGARPGELASIGRDARGWLYAQLANPVIPALVKKRYGGGLAGQPAALLKPAGMSKQEMAQMAADSRQIYVQESGARMLAQIRSDQSFIERMVLFWSNHFTVSVQKGVLHPLVNAYEAEAIRPHVGGYFKDMLLAVCRHPAMLIYLDNIRSFGPHSVRGAKNKKGLNENLAREILELHTLGVGAGYGQQDVIALAKIITGWTMKQDKNRAVIAFAFQEMLHEPGDKILLGTRIREEGEQEGVEALSLLARHPATARHVASKLVRHFVADDPPAEVVEAVAQSFIASGGHLPTVMRALIAQKAAWDMPLVKFKTPYEFAVSALRLTGVEPTPPQVMSGLDALNYKMFNALSPAGDDDVAQAWASPDAVMKRIEWGYKLAQRLPADVVPLALATDALGQQMSDVTRQTIERAASGRDGIGLLLASPEFQRR